ncbi:MAG TPA: acyltransferase family protein [Burkholderiales bacterium]|jgi:peptidoglycan/LPS O-acetylase OafA/YrhL|nr:acyltransferase family protein [Burkholderiales bacterium]
MKSALPSYRPDVDGLRAIAVLAVVAFHAFPGAAPGGFAGVDVFFVISGFLISSIIFDDLKGGRFSFAGFYWRRVRRIFPALVLVLAACLALGWLLMLPDEYAVLGKHVAAGAGFASNIVLWREAGYFDTTADLKPLLHLWSLGVEEQYYLVWPLLLFLFRGRRAQMLGMIATIAALSFAANIWLTLYKPGAAFFLPVGRFWELLAGSLLAYFHHYGRLPGAHRNVKAVLGAAMIAAAFALLDAKRAFPGWWALLPVLGTVLLIWAGPAAWLNRRVLSQPALVFVGLVSYPLYLWHWPLLSYARIAHDGEAPAAVRLALCALSLLLAWLTYELVEKKVRFPKVPAIRRVAVPALAASMAALGVAGVLALQSRLLPQSAALAPVREISSAFNDWEYGGDRVIVGDSGKTVLFFGDSHMQHYWPRIEKLLTEHAAAPRNTIILKTSGGCAPMPGIERKRLRCSQFVDAGFGLARQPEIDTVVIAASWVGMIQRGDYYRVGDPEQEPLQFLTPQTEWVLQGFQAALAELTAAGKHVVLILSSPRGSVLDPKSVIDREAMTVQVRGALVPLPRSELAALTAPIDGRLRRIAKAVHASVIDPADWLCSPKLCPSVDELGRPLYKDESHLRASVARERFSAIDGYVYLR